MKKLILIILFLFILPLVCFADFTVNEAVDEDVTITDNNTGLTWTQTSADTNDDGTPDAMNWEDALRYCETLIFAGKSDWRLPTNKELQSIVEYGNYDPTIDKTYFPDTISAYYWSSTSYVDYTDNAWAVYFYYGYVYGKPKTSEYNVRAVRGGVID